MGEPTPPPGPSREPMPSRLNALIQQANNVVRNLNVDTRGKIVRTFLFSSIMSLQDATLVALDDRISTETMERANRPPRPAPNDGPNVESDIIGITGIAAVEQLKSIFGTRSFLDNTDRINTGITAFVAQQLPELPEDVLGPMREIIHNEQVRRQTPLTE